MDVYRYFHPHHNPRLYSTPLRQQELSELEQAAAELRKAIERAQQRTIRKAPKPIMPSHFTDMIKAMYFVERSLQTLCDAHEGDSEAETRELIAERSELSGWEAWTKLFEEQLSIDQERVIRQEGLKRQQPVINQEMLANKTQSDKTNDSDMAGEQSPPRLARAG